jgi:aspartate 1-decarboxylase
MRLRTICKSKIHQATVTETNIEYVGSIAIDEDLLRRADILPGEKVHIWNLNNGERIETYALPAAAGSGRIIVNGAAARRCSPKDRIIIATFVLTDEPVSPRMILVDAQNRFSGNLTDNHDPAVPTSGLTDPSDQSA